MSEIEVGEYIRTKYGYIGKLLNYDENDVYFGDIECNFIIGGMPIEKENIKTHSKNIIDLIEYGDILEIFFNDNEIDREVVYGDILQAIKKGDLIAEDIKSILTHEHYEQYSYKVVE